MHCYAPHSHGVSLGAGGHVEFPEGLRYSREHEWARLSGERVRVGITSYAQDTLGDIVFVMLPKLGEEVTAGQPLGEVESTKSVSDVFAPVSGAIVARNETVEGSPELINSDPYGDGWLVEIQINDPSALDDLLDARGYADHVAAQP